MKKIAVIFYSVFVIACNNTNNTDSSSSIDNGSTTSAITAPTALNYTVEKVYAHDTSAYTQGLEWHHNILIEGTGLEAKVCYIKWMNNLNLLAKK